MFIYTRNNINKSIIITASNIPYKIPDLNIDYVVRTM